MEGEGFLPDGVELFPRLAKARRVVGRLVLRPTEPFASHGDHFVDSLTRARVEHDLGHMIMQGKITAEEAYEQIALFDDTPELGPELL